MSTILTLDLIVGNNNPSSQIQKSDPNSQIQNKAEFVSCGSPGSYSEIMFKQFTIPATAKFLKFDIETKFSGTNPALGSVNVGIQPQQGSSFFRSVQGNFKGTLALDLSNVSGALVAWLGIGFPAGAFGNREFIAIVSNLRFVDDTTVPVEELRDVPFVSDSHIAPPGHLHIIADSVRKQS
jgi:hypothetical protein